MFASLIAIGLLVVTLCGFSPNQAEAEQSEESSISRVGYSGDIEIYQDSKTGVQYLIYRDGYGYLSYSGMCPRYNADGTLYKGEQ